MANQVDTDNLLLHKEELETKINELSSENNLSDMEEEYLEEMENELEQINQQLDKE